ncbi:MAG: ABC transporter permease subunit [Clostridia bacterium]|nr:ABC transporter permease subunit [Clostridia bacterium]
MKKSVLQNCIYALCGVGVLIAVWVIAYYRVGNELVVPSFFDCVKDVGELLVKERFWRYFLNTFKRVFFAFVISFFVASAFALLAYVVPVVRGILSPIISLMRSLPILAVTLILWLMFGREDAPIAVAFLSLFPMLYAAMLSALSGVDGDLIEMSRVYNVPLKKRIFSLYMPAAAPYVLQESGAALAFSLKLVVSAEVLVGTYRSVGYLMNDANQIPDMSLLFALVCMTALVGLILESIALGFARAVERRVK